MRYLEKITNPNRTILFRGFLAAYEMAMLGRVTGKMRMLDIGGGEGIHRRFFKERGFDVDVLDRAPGLGHVDHVGIYEAIDVRDRFDILWLSHVLEHTRNPGLMIDKLFADVRDGGFVCVTVPPLRQKMTFAHPIHWSAGSLLINFIQSGFWCGDARIASYGYNISIIARKDTARSCRNLREALPDGLIYDGGYFSGDIKFLNWSTERIPAEDVTREFEDLSVEEIGGRIESTRLDRSFFFTAQDRPRERTGTYYFDAELAAAIRCA